MIAAGLYVGLFLLLFAVGMKLTRDVLRAPPPAEDRWDDE